MVTTSNESYHRMAVLRYCLTQLNLPCNPLSIARCLPTLSIAGLMSQIVILLVGLVNLLRAFCIKNAISPVPPARSNIASSAFGSIIIRFPRFHKRWILSDMISFITSYFGATLSNTSRTNLVRVSGAVFATKPLAWFHLMRCLSSTFWHS